MTTLTTASTAAWSEIVFIDGSLDNIDALRAGIQPGVGVFVLDPAGDGLAQMAQILSGYSNLAAVHLVSHGSAGSLSLGAATINQGSLAGYASALATIGGALSASGDLLLYGCDVAAGPAGLDFINALAAATGADVAASTDLTGAAFLGGDWKLEAASGAIEAQGLELTGFNGVLESPDIGATTATLGILPLNDTVTGTIGSLGDHDWYKVSLTAFTTYRFDLAKNQGSATPIADTYLRVYDAAGTTILAADDDAGGSAIYPGTSNNSRVSYTAGVTGNFFVDAAAYVDAYTGDYKLRVMRVYNGSAAGDSPFGDANNDYMIGGLGNDTMKGAGGDDSLQGDGGNDNLQGSAGADTLEGGTGGEIDTMIGGTGHDVYFVDSSGDVVTENAGEGTDLVISNASYFFLTANVEDLLLTSSAGNGYGNAENNTITGNDNANYLYGYDGDDSILGQSGADYIWGGNGNDTLQGGNGNDTLLGDFGDDVLMGGNGADNMDGGGGNDSYFVDDVADVTVEYDGTATGGTDTVNASADHTIGQFIENLVLVEGSGAVNGTGNASNNTITGNSFANTLTGNGGDDTFTGGAGADTFVGGEGNDTYNLVPADGDVITEAAGQGTDTAVSAATYSIAAVANVENITLTGAAVANATGNTLDNALTGNNANNTLTGDLGADTLDGGAGTDTLDGGAGNDTYIVDTTTDTITDSAGTDTVRSSVSFTLATALENLVLTGASASATGNASNNQITGSSGNDTLNGSTGTDTLEGGAGNDTFVVDSTTDSITDISGTDTVQSSVTFSIAALGSIENLTLTGTAAALTGNSLNNTITGNTGNDTLDGGTGTDTLVGGSGNDTYIVDTTTDTITDSAGTDTIQSSVTFSIASMGSIENITLTGGGAINATGNTLANNIVGNNGDNLVTPGTGNVADTVDGGAGTDKLRLSGNQSAWTLGTVASQTRTATNAGTGQTVQFTRIEYLQFDDIDNVLSGLSVTVAGGAGNDLTLVGSGGDDYIDGKAGNDSMVGNAGDDRFDLLGGNSGNDTMVGGAGDDTYLVDSTADVVTELANEGNNDWIYATVSYVLPNNVENIQAIASGSINLTGNGLNNSIYGNTGANSLAGAGGNDLLYDYTDGFADTMNGGAGDDTYYVFDTNDTIVEASGEGTDQVYAGATTTLSANVENLYLQGYYYFSTNINGTGNALPNLIIGDPGNNVINGMAGADTMNGGAGNDTYVVDAAGDVVTEFFGDGTDTVQSSISYTLTDNVESLTLTGLANLNGTGNSGNNTLTGNSGNNVLNGGAGTDTLIGGAGNDTFVVDTTSDSISDISGTDTVQSSVTFTLASLPAIENLTLTGAAVNGTGNAAANFITGNSAANSLTGDLGDDTLAGGAGDDTFSGGAGNDVIIGGSGVNSVFYTQAESTYVFGVDQYGAITVRATVGAEGTDSLSQVQELVFSDGSVQVDSLGVGTDLRVGAAFNAGFSSMPDVAQLAGGGYVVTWSEIGSILKAQIYSAVGTPVGSEISVQTQYGNPPTVAALADGGFVVAYYGYEDVNTFQTGITAKRYASDGTLVSSSMLLNAYGQLEASALAGGGYVIALASDSSNYPALPATQAGDAVAVIVDADGAVSAVNLSNAPGYDYNPTVAGTSDGGFVAAWQGSNGNIYARQFSATGVATGALVDASGAYGYSISVAALGGGGSVVAWAGYSGQYGLHARRLDEDGAATGSVFAVNTVTAANFSNISLAALASGGFVAVWEADDGNDIDLVGQLFAADGSMIGGEIAINSQTDFSQRVPEVAALGDGFVVTWRSEAGNAGGIFTQRFDAAGHSVGGLLLTGNDNAELLLATDALQSVRVDGAGGDDSITGGGAADTLQGGDGNDILDGGGGAGVADSMEGGVGDDIYIIRADDPDADDIFEGSDAGIDEIRSAAFTYVMPETEVERLVLTGGVNGEGNSIANVIIGNTFSNQLRGNGGNDTLLGGAGTDRALYSGDMGEYVFGVDARGAISVRHAAVAAGGDDTDTLQGIQSASFANGVITVGTVAAIRSEIALNTSPGEYVSDTGAAVALSQGRMLVAWYGSSSGGNGIHVQTIDSNGLSSPAQRAVADPATASPGYGYINSSSVELVRLAAGSALAWTEFEEPDGPGPLPLVTSLKMQLLDPDGTPLGGVSTLAQISTYGIQGLDSISLADGGFALVYKAYNGSADENHVLRFDAAGGLVADTIATTDYTSPPVSVLPDGGWITLTRDYVFVPAGGGVPAHTDYWIRGQRFGADGAATSATFELSARDTNSSLAYAYDAKVVPITSASFGGSALVVVWQVYNNNDYDVFAQVVSDSSTPTVLLSEQLVPSGDTSFTQNAFNVAALPSGGFVIAWSQTNSSQTDVLARVYNAAGVATTAQPIRVNTDTAGTQRDPEILITDDGGFAINFHDNNSSSLYTQRYDADGRKIGGLSLTGTSAFDTLNASDAVQAVYMQGLTGADSLTGGSANDTLEGNNGHDVINGGGGIDSLIGGNGNDTYLYDGSADIIVELEGQGVDTVRAAASYTLPEGPVENIVLADYRATVAGFDLNFNGTGNSRNNSITGNAGTNTLDGGQGTDTLIGGDGDDTYVVDATGDMVTELANEGVDLVQSSVTYTLSANVENLTLTGSGDIDGTGNALANRIIGNSGKNVLVGGDGGDTYVVDAVDTVTEGAGGGTDTIEAAATYSLASIAEVENLLLTGSANIDGTGNSLNNAITGNSGNNSLVGGSGDDTITGNGGTDTLAGGIGEDVLIVDDAGDVVQELTGEGNADTVRSSVTYTLPTGTTGKIENLVLTGTGAINGTGNDLNNSITGNSAANVISGGTGLDTMAGGDGNDTYVVDNAGDTVTELFGQGTDTVQSSITITLLAGNVENLLLTGSSAINGTGNTLDNSLTGNSGDNQLDGGAGADNLAGAAGNDTYIVDNTGDLVTEGASAGTDTVRTSLATYTLTVNVENLVLTGTTALDGFGNTLNNSLTGNSLNNNLDGGVGLDTMVGGKGDDFYYVDNAGDLVTENAGEGSDTVFSSLSAYVLPRNVESLALSGTGNINGTGNFLSNIIYGNSGNNIIDGGQFVDVLIGAAGNDTYIVDTPDDIVIENTGEGTDTVSASVSYVLPGDVENLTLTGSNSNDATGNTLANVLTGNTGANILSGLEGADSIDGGNGNDSIDGGSENDSLTGGLGNDTVEGGLGADTMVGGDGDDTYRVDNVGDVVSETIADNAGTPTVREGGSDTVESTLSYTLGTNVENLILLGTANLLGTGNSLSNQIIGNSGNNLLTGLGGDDLLKGDGGTDTMVGGDGNDLYYVDSTDDVVTEATGSPAGTTDIIYATFANDALHPYVLPVNVEYINYFDINFLYAVGNSLNNYFTGNAGDNILDGAGGADTMVGGVGNDTYYVDDTGDQATESSGEGTDKVVASVNFILGANVEDLELAGSATQGTGNGEDNNMRGTNGNNLLNGSGGEDTADYGNAGSGVVVDLDGGQATGGGGTDTLISIENATGGNYGDSMTGSAGDNVLDGGEGSDTIEGGAGNDTLIGGLGADTYIVDDIGDTVVETDNNPSAMVIGLDLGSAIDSVLASISYTLTSFVENLNLATGAGGLTGTGNELDNTLVGNESANNLDGLGGNDTLIGAGGNDTLTGGLGTDTADYTGATDALVINLATLTAQVVSAGQGSDILSGIENLVGGLMGDNFTGDLLNNVMTGNGGNDTMLASDGFDTLIGGDGDDSLSGMNNGDSLVGGNGNDWLGGGKGQDIIDGGADNDTLIGGLGLDTMTGGTGTDAFLFASALDGVLNVDTITDFTSGTDKIQLSAAIFTAFAAQVGQTHSLGTLPAGFLAYNATTGALAYDADGAGAGVAMNFVFLGATTHPASLGTDFQIVA